MFHALHNVDMRACYAKQKINLACPNYRFFFPAHIQNLYCDPSHLTQNKWECIVTHFSNFYDTELLDVRYIVAYSIGSLEFHPGPRSGRFWQN